MRPRVSWFHRVLLVVVPLVVATFVLRSVSRIGAFDELETWVRRPTHLWYVAKDMIRALTRGRDPITIPLFVFVGLLAGFAPRDRLGLRSASAAALLPMLAIPNHLGIALVRRGLFIYGGEPSPDILLRVGVELSAIACSAIAGTVCLLLLVGASRRADLAADAIGPRTLFATVVAAAASVPLLVLVARSLALASLAFDDGALVVGRATVAAIPSRLVAVVALLAVALTLLEGRGRLRVGRSVVLVVIALAPEAIVALHGRLLERAYEPPLSGSGFQPLTLDADVMHMPTFLVGTNSASYLDQERFEPGVDLGARARQWYETRDRASRFDAEPSDDEVRSGTRLHSPAFPVAFDARVSGARMRETLAGLVDAGYLHIVIVGRGASHDPFPSSRLLETIWPMLVHRNDGTAGAVVLLAPRVGAVCDVSTFRYEDETIGREPVRRLRPRRSVTEVLAVQPPCPRLPGRFQYDDRLSALHLVLGPDATARSLYDSVSALGRDAVLVVVPSRAATTVP